MTDWIVRESTSDRIFQITTKHDNSEDVYYLFAQQILGLDTTGDFDTGNVDIDVEKVIKQKANIIKEVFKDE